MDEITEIHSYIRDIAIRKPILPIILTPKTEVKLEITSNIPEASTKLFVHVFSFTNKRNNTQLNLVKEIVSKRLRLHRKR